MPNTTNARTSDEYELRQPSFLAVHVRNSVVVSRRNRKRFGPFFLIYFTFLGDNLLLTKRKLLLLIFPSYSNFSFGNALTISTVCTETLITLSSRSRIYRGLWCSLPQSLASFIISDFLSLLTQ